MISVLKALAVTAGIFVAFSTYLWTPGKGWASYGEVTKSDWILICIVSGALFLVLAYAFSR
jgi:hypothetical protein